MLLLERFFEEVFESTKLCLNGNMARLMNVFACVDEDIHPQDGSKVYTPEILQTSIFQIIHNLEWDIDEMVHKIRTVLFEAQLPLESWGDWIDAAIDERLNLQKFYSIRPDNEDEYIKMYKKPRHANLRNEDYIFGVIPPEKYKFALWNDKFGIKKIS